MTRPVFVLRPEPGLTATLVAAFEKGIPARGIPLSEVQPEDWNAPAEPFDALLIGSANAIRHAGKELEKVAHLPVLAVGETTADVARQAGLTIEKVGQGGLQKLLDQLSDNPRKLLRLAGEKHLKLAVPEHLSIATQIVYRAHYRALSPAQKALLSEGSIIMLHSGETAQHFLMECERLRMAKGGLTLVAMAPRIAEMAGEGWGSLHIATAPSDAAVLDLVAQLCQDS